MRHPLKLAAQDWMRRKRYPRTAACEALALAYAFAAAAAFGAAMYLGDMRPLIALIAGFPLALFQFAYDVRNRGRDIAPETTGVIAPGSVAAAIALAAQWRMELAFALWIVIAARAVPSILYVRSLLRGGHNARIAHVAAVAVAATLWLARLAPISASLAMLVLLSRARPVALPARSIGVRELGYGALVVGVIAAGYLI